MSTTTQQELVISRTVAAPLALVFKTWTEAAHIAKWWGPHWFTNRVHAWEARPGGAIHLDMVGPDGTAFPMKGLFHEVAPARIVFTSQALMDEAGEPFLEALNTVTFAEQDGQTTFTVSVVVVKAAPEAEGALAGMETGWHQTLERFEALVLPPGAASDREIILTRTYDAPRSLVFKACTEAEHVARWWGPNGFTITNHEMDVRPGGIWRFIMHGPDGTDYPNKIVYLEVVKPERLYFAHGEDGECPPPPFHVTVTFTEEGGKTTLTQRTLFSSAGDCEAVKAFGAVELGQQTYARLADYLAAM